MLREKKGFNVWARALKTAWRGVKRRSWNYERRCHNEQFWDAFAHHKEVLRELDMNNTCRGLFDQLPQFFYEEEEDERWDTHIAMLFSALPLYYYDEDDAHAAYARAESNYFYRTDEENNEYDHWVSQVERMHQLRSLNETYELIQNLVMSGDVEPQSGEEYLTDKDYNRSAVNRSRNARAYSKKKGTSLSVTERKKLVHDKRVMHNSSRRGAQNTDRGDGGVQPESGLQNQTISDLFGEHSNGVLSHCENFLALCCGLSGATNYQSMASILFLYVKTISSKSLCSTLWSYICGIFADDYDLEAVTESTALALILPHAGTDFIDTLKNLGRNFKLLTSNPVFPKISYLISACVCVGLCETSAVSWTVAGIRLFNPNVYMKHVNAVDLMDAVLSTVTYFVEGGYEFFKTGSLGAFLFSDSKIEKLQDDYNFLRACSVHFRVGSLKRDVDMDDHEYSAKMASTIADLKKLSRLSSGAEKMVLDRMVTHLCELSMEFDATRVQGGIREKPYTIMLTGSSGVGKSTLTCALPPILGMLNGYDGSPSKTATCNGDDKFQSNIKGDTTTYILDDIFNTHKDFLQISPTENWITFSNNAMHYVNKADLDEKGRVATNPKALIGTSNLKDGGAKQGSNEPSSVERRTDVHIETYVKFEFRVDGGVSLDWRKVHKHYAAKNEPIPPLPDVWELALTDPTVVPNPAAGGKDVIEYRPFYGSNADGTPRRVGVIEFLRFLRDHSAAHFAAQRQLVDSTNSLHTRISKCEHCGHISLACQCTPEVQAGFMEYAKPALSKAFFGVVSDWTTVTGKMAIAMLNASLHGVLGLAPDSILAKVFRTSIYYFYPRMVYSVFQDRNFVISLAFTVYFLWLAFFHTVGYFLGYLPDSGLVPSYIYTVLALISGCIMWHVYSRTKTFQEHCIFIAQRDYKLIKADIVHNLKRVRVDRLLAASATLATAYWMIKHWQRAKRMFYPNPQGNLDPQDYADIEERDAEVNIWMKNEPEPILFERRLMTHSMEDLIPKVARNLCYVRIKSENGYRVCDAFFVRTNVCVLPYHMLFPGADPTGPMPEDWFVRFHRRAKDMTGSSFAAHLDRTSFIRVPDTDFVVVNVDAGGDFADLTYLLTDLPYSGPAMFVYKDGDGALRREPTTITQRDDAHHKYCTFKGADYHLKGGTGAGLCMGMLLSQDKGKRIVGFHLGGKAPTYGVCGLLTQHAFSTALDELNSDGRIIPHSSGEFVNECYGKTIITSTEISKYSPVNYLDLSGNFNTYGSCGGGATITSQVVTSILSELVHLKMGIPNTFGPPILVPKYLPYRENLLTLSNPTDGFEPRRLLQAKNDYLCPILKTVRTRAYVKDMIRVLTDLEVVNGIPKVRFIDKMNMNTSAGFPLDQPKKHFLVELPATTEYANPVTFTQEIWDEVHRVEELLAQGKRAYIIYKACVKDEPTSTLKTKAPRIINSAPIAMQILTRRYFLGLCRFMNCHPFLCESMVGINCMGPEWEQHRQYMTRNGTMNDRTFALDYSKYDHFTSPQVSMMTYRMFIEICEATGNFTPRDIRIMHGIATEAVYPFVAFNGTLLSWNGTTISGTSITVYQNNGNNSLYQRLGFIEVELVPRNLTLEELPFRSVVRVGDYGDDLKGTVNKKAKFFNMRTFQEYLALRGIKVTMPDKSAEMVEFMNWDEADFLKRKDSFIKEIGFHVGALDEMSIAKSLHSNLRNKNLSREQLAIAVITGAVFEYWAHGREISDKRCAQLREIAEELELDVPALGRTYDEQTASWKERYAKEIDRFQIVEIADEDSTEDPYIYRDINGNVVDRAPWYTEVTSPAED